jgi:hypothetical protein
MHANVVKNLAKSPLLPSVLALLARIVILKLYRLALTEVPSILKTAQNIEAAKKHSGSATSFVTICAKLCRSSYHVYRKTPSFRGEL